MQGSSGSDRALALTLVGVIAVMLWPIWLAAVSGQRSFTWTVAATALIPLSVSLLVIAIALRLPSRIAHGYHRLVHALGERLHAGTHRHA